ncbi:Protein Ves [Achromobacter deleyi]|uniref:Protein Ves n=3 Tax=Achromobacter deleyi TaxID=1353891 RepID=A0A6S7ACG5_9BURK|nr:HutD family protein [Achromobacter deleyi]CAB3725532.1 Protein Ves [Achromobacter deleyi]CAB3916948.1 Protein Ves [Achromobacter deleyi]
MAQFPETGGARRGPWQALPPEPWKNGGGVTRTLAADKDAAESAAARWRVSIADITRDGPYSRFAGDDRVSVVLSGAGVVLRDTRAGLRDECLPRGNAGVPLRDAGVPLRDAGAQVCDAGAQIWLAPGQPVAFAGDAAWHGTLVDGPVQVLNLFVRRGSARARVRGVNLASPAGPADAPAGVSAGALALADGAARHLQLCVALVAGRWQTPDGATELAAGEFLLRRAACPGSPVNPGDPGAAAGQAVDAFTPSPGVSRQAPGLAAVLLDIFY